LLKLPENHPLRGFGPGTGYMLAEPKEKPLFVDLSTEIDLTLPVVLPVNMTILEPKKTGPVPIRDMIPETKGRLETWKLLENVAKAQARNWPGLIPFDKKGRVIAICAGGPSLRYTLPEIRALQKAGGDVLAINRTHDFLLGLPKTHGIPWIKPNFGMLIEALPTAAAYMDPRQDVEYWIASQCDPVIFDRFEKYPHRMFHCRARPEMDALLSKYELMTAVPTSGSTSTLRAIAWAYMRGYTEIHVFGIDSSYSRDDLANGKLGLDGMPMLHGYAKPEAIHDIIELTIKDTPFGDLKFHTNRMMAAQVEEFKKFMAWREEALAKRELDPHHVVIHGFGAIPQMAELFGYHATQFERKKSNVLH
jgi:hypothetical protein